MNRLVRFIGTDPDQIRFGKNDDPRGLLIVGKEYELDHAEIYHWHTQFTLKDFPDKKFNSVCFEEI